MFNNLRIDILNARKELYDKYVNSSNDGSNLNADDKDAIELLQESLPNIDLSLDGKQVHAYAVKPLDEPLLNSSFKSTLKKRLIF